MRGEPTMEEGDMETKEENRMMNAFYESKLSTVQCVTKSAGVLALIGSIGVIGIAFNRNAGEKVGETPNVKPALIQTAAAASQIGAATQGVPRERVDADNDQQRDWRPGGSCRDC